MRKALQIAARHGWLAALLLLGACGSGKDTALSVVAIGNPASPFEKGVRLPQPADAVFSVGLVEHYDSPGVEDVVEAHFRQTKPGGWVLISVPCPTRLYRATRALLEFAGLWRFPDERPLPREEVLAAALRCGELVWERTLWPLLLTQHMMLFRARVSSD